LYNAGYIDIPTITGFDNTTISYFTWFYSNQKEENCNLGAHGTALPASPDWSFDALGTLYSNSGNPALGITIGASTFEFDIPDWTQDKQWHYVGFTYDTNNIKLYYDGELLGGTASSAIGAMPAIEGPFRLSGPSSLASTGPAAGQVPDLSSQVKKLDFEAPFTWINAIIAYNKVIDDATIKKHYNAAISEYNNLKVRAKAYTKNAWISGYELIPKYANLGRVITFEPPGIFFDESTFDETSRFGAG
jgi:hypothetical protein